MPFRRIVIPASILALLLAASVPVNAAPALQTGTHSSYNLSASISFFQSCVPSPTSSLICPTIAVCNPTVATCPMSTDITGTIGWTVTDLTSTSASLNVTHDLSISGGDTTRPTIQSVGSINESIDLATRLVSLIPMMLPEMDQLIQIALSSASKALPGLNPITSAPTMESMIPQHQLHTMWWVNGPLKLNDTVPVLVFPTNVTQASKIDLGGTIGQRDAWSLEFNFSTPLLTPDPTTTLSPIPSGNVEVGLVFNYDKASDILLSATADIQFGFEDAIPIPPSPCDTSASVMCPLSTNPTLISRNFGMNLEASLKLSNTTVDLSQRMTQTAPQPDNSGSQSSGGSSNGNGSGASNGSGSGGQTGGAGPGSNTSGATGSNGQASGTTNEPGNQAKSTSWSSWIYVLLGIFAAAVIASAIWISRRRSNSLPADRSSTET